MTDVPPPLDPADVKRRRNSRLLGMIVMTMSGLIAGLCGRALWLSSAGRAAREASAISTI